MRRPCRGGASRAADPRARRSVRPVVELRERLRQTDKVLEVGHLRIAANVTLTDERASVDGREHHVVAADVRGVRRVARLELELLRRLRDLLEDELGVKPDAVLVLDDLAGRAQDLDGLGQQELDPELGDDPSPSPVENGHRVLAEDLVTGHGVDEQAGLLKKWVLTFRLCGP